MASSATRTWNCSNGCSTSAPARPRQQLAAPRRCAHLRVRCNAAPPVRGVIFDVDGVLCSSEHLSRMAAAAALKQLHGINPQPDEFIPFGGQGEARFLGGVAEKYGVRGFDVAEASARFLDIYINEFACGPRGGEIGYPGAVELVRALRAAGLKTAVASSAAPSKVDANLAAAGFDASDFGCVVSGTSFARNKPAPDVFLAAAAGLGLPPAECVVLEDAPAGIQAARAAGMRVIGIATMLGGDELASHAPDAAFPEVGGVMVADITGLQWREGAAPARAGAGAGAGAGAAVQ